MFNRNGFLLTAATVFCLRAGAAEAEVRLATLFSDQAVFQQGTAIPVWGRAEPGEKVTVALAGREAETTADADGRWQVRLPALEATFGPLVLEARGTENTATAGGVMVGEVWLCSGQSNMAMTLDAVRDGAAEVAAADYPAIRMFTVFPALAEEPAGDGRGRWASFAPDTAGSLSAAAYFFGRELHRELGVPVGLVHASVGGTLAQVWLSRRALEADERLAPILNRWAQAMAGWDLALYPQPRGRANDYYHAGRAAARELGRRLETLRAAGGEAPAEEEERYRQHQRAAQLFGEMPAGRFNAMIYPHISYAVRGAAWYQGEANTANPELYRALLPALITDWRAHRGQGDFPFLVVGLPNYRARRAEPGDSSWARLREAQFLTAQTLPGVGFANTIDIGEAGDIHPKNKQEVGRRLALVALALVYGREIEFSGPVFRALDITPAGARVYFDHARDGLVTADGQPARGFALAGADGRWHWAQAAIEGDSALLACPAVPEPLAVRYAWADNPDVNLCNRAGLPAVPFRTDDLPAGAGRLAPPANN